MERGQSLIMLAILLALIVLFLLFWAQGGNVSIGTMEYQAMSAIERIGNAIMGK